MRNDVLQQIVDIFDEYGGRLYSFINKGDISDIYWRVSNNLETMYISNDSFIQGVSIPKEKLDECYSKIELICKNNGIPIDGSEFYKGHIRVSNESKSAHGYILPPLRFVLDKKDEGALAKLECRFIPFEQKPIIDSLNESNRRRKAMEIGGIGITFKMNVPIDSGMHYIRRILSKCYPNGVIEADPWPSHDDFFIYENQDAKDIWDHGGVEDSMIYVLGSKDSVTLVVGKNARLVTKMVESFHILGGPKSVFRKIAGG